MRILITRPLTESLICSERLIALGHSVIIEPLLTINFNQKQTISLGGIYAILITSGNGVRALALATLIRDIPLYVVGAVTAKIAMEARFSKIVAANSSVNSLFNLVIDQVKHDSGKLLHITGPEVKGDLVANLERLGYNVERRVLYGRTLAAAFTTKAYKALDNDLIDAVLFFSQSAAKVFVKLIIGENLATKISNLVLFCSSSDIAKELEGLESKLIIVTSEPTTESMIKQIEYYDRK